MNRASWIIALALALPACGGDSSAPDVIPSPIVVASPSPVPSPVTVPVPGAFAGPVAHARSRSHSHPEPHATPHASSAASLAAPPLPDVIVNINGQAFSPSSVSVSVGQRVIWRNNDTVAHTATANNGAFNTGFINPGGQASVTMTSAGTFNYFCAVHPNLTGTVSVSP